MSKLSQRNLLILLPILVILAIFSTFFYFSQSNSNSNSSQKPISSAISSYNSELNPLVADAEHDVVVLEECDLAVRYKKPTEEEKQFNFTYSKDEEGIYYLYYVSKSNQDTFMVRCGAKNYYEQDLTLIGKKEESFLNWFSRNKPSSNFCSELGIKNIVCSKIEPLMQTEGSGGIKGFYFKQNNIFYSVDVNNTDGSNLLDTFQPNSLAPSTPSVKL